MPTSRYNFLRAWLPALVWIGIIATESTEYFSAQNTGAVLYSLATRLFGEINSHDFFVFHHYLRKTGHVVGYGILCLLLLRGWHATLGCAQGWDWRAALLAWVGTAFVASMDEWHQSFLPSRGASGWDVALDSAAGLLFLIFAYLRYRRSALAEQLT